MFEFIASKPCDLSDILVKQANGKYDFGDYKERFERRTNWLENFTLNMFRYSCYSNQIKIQLMQERAYGDLKLSNIGKLKREKAEFYHRNDKRPSGKEKRTT